MECLVYVIVRGEEKKVERSSREYLYYWVRRELGEGSFS
jgi:hypothetical protein